MGLESLQEGVQNVFNTTVESIKANPVATALVGGSVATGAVLGAGALVLSKRKKSSKRKRSRKKSSSRRSRRRKGRRRTPRTAGKGKDRSTKRIRYTKKGQPYIILRSGKARFIKMSSAKRSHKRKGGRY